MSGERVGRVSLDVIDYHQHNVRTDLGDLRSLADSIRRFGVMQPVVLEQRGQRLRIRAGHRRVAAARLAGLTRIPAIVHADALDDDEWLTAAVHENTRRRDLDPGDRARAAAAMRAEGMTWDAIGAAFGVTGTSARRMVEPYAPREVGEVVPRATGTGRPSMRRSVIRTFTEDARNRVAAGVWTAGDLLDALERLADDGTLTATFGPLTPVADAQDGAA